MHYVDKSQENCLGKLLVPTFPQQHITTLCNDYERKYKLTSDPTWDLHQGSEEYLHWLTYGAVVEYKELHFPKVVRIWLSGALFYKAVSLPKTWCKPWFRLLFRIEAVAVKTGSDNRNHRQNWLQEIHICSFIF